MNQFDGIEIEIKPTQVSDILEPNQEVEEEDAVEIGMKTQALFFRIYRWGLF